MTIEETQSFGPLLRRYRRAAGLTQKSLAERAALSTRGIQDLERGVSQTPRAATIDLLAAALDLPESDRAELRHAAGRQLQVRKEAGPSHFGSPSRLVPLVGRRAELAALDHLLTGGDPGAGPVAAPLLLLAGEPGIGKTRLLQAAAQQAVGQGWSVLARGCYRRGGQEPYSPILDALARYLQVQPPTRLAIDLEGCAWLVHLLPEFAGVLQPPAGGTLAPDQERRLLFAAVARLLGNVAGPAGTLLVLDDLQWAGVDALDLLAVLARSAGGRLRIVVGYRDTDVMPSDALAVLVGDLAQAGLVQQLSLGPLSGPEATVLLDDLLVGSVGTDDAVAEHVLQRAGGTPFFLISYAQSLSAGSGEMVPWDLAQGIRQRVALLSESEREMVAAAAIAGRQVPRGLLLAVVAGPESEMLAGLEELCRARLLLEDGDRAYVFAHDVIREVVEIDVGAARRAVLHRRVAMALESERTAPVELLAYHYGRSDAQERAARYLEQAGDQAWAQQARGAAERHYRDLLDLLERAEPGADTARASEKLSHVLARTGRFAGALPLLREAAWCVRSLA